MPIRTSLPCKRREVPDSRIVRRIAESAAYLLAGTVVVFALLRPGSGGHRLALVQYVAWLFGMLHGDFGFSRSFGDPVGATIAEGLPATIELIVAALVAVVAVGALGGALRARVRSPLASAVLAALELVARSLPLPLLGVLLLLSTIFTPLDWQTIAVPLMVLSIALPYGAWSSSVFYDTLRRRGDAAATTVRDLMRGAALSLSLIGPVVATSTFLVEGWYAWRGTGRLFQWALSEWDVPLVAGLLVVYWTAIVLLKFVAGLWLSALDGPPDRTDSADAAVPERSAFRGNPLGLVGLVLCGVFAAAALGANVLAPADPNYIDQVHWSGYPLAPGAGGHLLGTEENGRDLLSRLLIGLQTSLGIAVFAALVATAVGSALAALAKRVFWFADGSGLAAAGIRSLGAYPLAVAALGVIIVDTKRLNSVELALVIAAVSWPAVAAAFCGGSRSVARAVLSAAVAVTASSVLFEVALSSRGVGVEPPRASLGNLLANAQLDLTMAPWAVFIPLVVIVMVLFALNAVADALRERT